MDPRHDGDGGRKQAKADGKTPGAAGHPEPGSQHDDSKLETVEEGPDTPIVDGQPGAFGDVETVGGAATQSNIEGKATEVDR